MVITNLTKPSRKPENKNIEGDGKIDETMRLGRIAFAYAFSTATLPTTGGEEWNRI